MNKLISKAKSLYELIEGTNIDSEYISVGEGVTDCLMVTPEDDRGHEMPGIVILKFGAYLWQRDWDKVPFYYKDKIEKAITEFGEEGISRDLDKLAEKCRNRIIKLKKRCKKVLGNFVLSDEETFEFE